MKLTTSVISGLALCVVNVAAQDFGSLPNCAKDCATNALPPSCGLDVTCICSTSSFITSVSCCVATACDTADQQSTIQFAEQLCAGAGITSLPSAAGCSATGAATSASSGTSTASAGTSATAAGTTSVAAGSTAVTSAKTSASAVSTAATSGQTSATSATTSTASASAASTSHSGAATPMAKSNGIAAAGVGAAALLAAIFV